MTRTLLLVLTTACGSTAPSGDTSKPTAPTGTIAVTPALVDLGVIPLQQQSTGTFTISNTGQGDLHVYDVQFEDDSMRVHWSLSGGLSGTLAPGASTPVSVLGHPKDLVDPTARLDVLSDDPLTPIIHVTLTATVSGEPQVRLQPYTLDFGVVAIGAQSVQSIVIANDGDTPLHVSGVTAPTAPFSVTVDPTGTTIPPRTEDGLIQVRFSTETGGSYTSALQVQTDDPDTPSATVSLAAVASGH